MHQVIRYGVGDFRILITIHMCQIVLITAILEQANAEKRITTKCRSLLPDTLILNQAISYFCIPILPEHSNPGNSFSAAKVRLAWIFGELKGEVTAKVPPCTLCCTLEGPPRTRPFSACSRLGEILDFCQLHK
jgi:hypothetical protein